MGAPYEPSTGHRFGRPRLLAGDGPRTAYAGNQAFQPLPAPVGSYPYHLDLASVIGQAAVQEITAAGEMAFHMAGDTGGIANPVPQENVALALEQDVTGSAAGWTPLFLYLLGDCIYFNGEETKYFPQFYDPYAHYNLPIFAIPGNHDGDPLNASQTSLDGFLQNFCTANPQANSAAGDSGRTTMTQPNVYWTLDTPLATIIGLYTNVPEGGHLDDTQVAWLNNELTSAPTGKALLVTMHHPPISADDHHGSSPYMMQLLDTAMQATSRLPDLICAGHVHDFQRHTRDASAVGGTGSLTYLVAGAGGYHNLHTIAADVKALTLPAPFPGMTGIMIEAFCDDRYGYLRLKVSPSQIDLQYVSVSPQPGVAPSAINPTVIDSATVPVRGG
jgi:acid phosphatase type 7